MSYKDIIHDTRLKANLAHLPSHSFWTRSSAGVKTSCSTDRRSVSAAPPGKKHSYTDRDSLCGNIQACKDFTVQTATSLPSSPSPQHTHIHPYAKPLKMFCSHLHKICRKQIPVKRTKETKQLFISFCYFHHVQSSFHGL